MATITNLSQLDLNGTYSYADYLKWRFDEHIELLRGKIAWVARAQCESSACVGRFVCEYTAGQGAEVDFLAHFFFDQSTQWMLDGDMLVGSLCVPPLTLVTAQAF